MPTFPKTTSGPKVKKPAGMDYSLTTNTVNITNAKSTSPSNRMSANK